jgi:hypothetical protein
MTNIFSIIKQSILNNYSPTYGEIINENKGEVFNNAVQNMCSDEEFEQYNMLKNMDKHRLLKGSNEEINEKKMGHTPQKNVNVAGIGDVIQIC